MKLNSDSLDDFERARNLGLRPEIRNEEQYLAKVAEGIDRAKELLRGEEQLALSVPAIQDLHHEIFCELYPPEAQVAGEFTQVPLMITGPGGYFVAGSPVHKIG